MNADLNFSVLLRKSDLTGIHSQRERQTDRQTDRQTYRHIDTDRLALFRPIPNLQVKQLFHQGNRIICHDCFHCHAFFPLPLPCFLSSFLSMWLLCAFPSLCLMYSWKHRFHLAPLPSLSVFHSLLISADGGRRQSGKFSRLGDRQIDTKIDMKRAETQTERHTNRNTRCGY